MAIALMIEDDFFYGLPPDPEEAFPMYERHIRHEAFKADWEDRENDTLERDYISYIVAFLDAYGLEVGIDRVIPASRSEFWGWYEETSRRIQIYAAQCRLRSLARNKAGAAAIYVLDTALRMEIHHHIDQIRRLVSEASISESKRDALSKKLNAFSEEVDRNRTRIDALAAAYIWTKREVKAGVQPLKPVLIKIEKLLDRITKATDWVDSLPSPDQAGQLEAPPKQIETNFGQDGEPCSLDDGIPF